MRRFGTLRVLLVVFVLLVAAWIVNSTEWGEVEVPTRLRGEAATNPFYAAQRLVETLGATSERREALGDTGTDSVVVLFTWAWDIDSARRAQFERWVESGGRLVVDASLISGSEVFERWSGIRHEREEIDPADEDPFRMPEAVEPCEELLEVADGRAFSPTGVWYEVCDFDTRSWFETAKPVLWSLDDDGRLLAVRVAVGRGTVTVLNGVPFVYRRLFDGQHGELLAAAADLRAGDHVVFMSEADVASLPELVWRHGAPVVVVLFVFIALALWRGAMRFGPPLAPPELTRRSLAEQILGTGRFVLRAGGGAALLAAARRALDEAAVRRIGGYDRLAPEERAAAVAKLAGVDARELEIAFGAHQGPRPPELRAALTLLESARRQLVLGGQWTKHGKRI